MDNGISVNLLSMTESPLLIMVDAAKRCVSNLTAEELLVNSANMNQSEMEKYLINIIHRGHLSILEFADFVFSIDGISRVASHQLVRHRMASYAQQSLRYTKSKQFVTPSKFENNKDLIKIYNECIDNCIDTYDKLISMGIDIEDARYVLPMSITSSINIKMNARELYNFFQTRLCIKTQEEMRIIAEKMLECLYPVSDIFHLFGPQCQILGRCPENNKQCPNYPN